MIVAVIDTNVLASGIIGSLIAASTPGEVLRRWRRQAFQLATSEHILRELTRTLDNPYFSARLSIGERNAALAELRREARLVAIASQVEGVAPSRR